MAPSPSQQQLSLVSFSIMVDGNELSSEYHIVEIEVKRELNKIPVAFFKLLDGDPSDVEIPISEKDEFVAGKSIKITAGYHQTEETIFEGIITSAAGGVAAEDMGTLNVSCVAKAAKLTTDRKNQNFSEMKDSEIIQKLISDAGLTPTVDSTEAKHERVLQFNASAWDMILMRADLAGLVVVVDNDKVDVVKPKTSGAVLTLTHGTDIMSMEMNVDSRHQYASVTSKTWDSSTGKVVEKKAKEPTVPSAGNQDGKKLAGTLGTEDYVVHSVGAFDQSEMQMMADSRLQRSRLSLIRGKVSFAGHAAAVPNSTIELKGVGARYNGEVYISGVSHKLKDGTWDTEVTVGMSPESFSESQAGVMTPPASGMVPGVSGMQIGTVQKIHDDPENANRILIDLPMIEESGSGVWARQSLYYGTNAAGNFWMPEIGDEVVVSFLNGDPRYPIIVGSVYSKRLPSPYTPDEPNTYKAITTNSKMKIEFEDVKKIITIWTPNNNQIVISDDEQSITILDETTNKVVMDPKGINMYTPKDMVVKADGKISIEAGMTIAMKAGQAFTIEGLSVESKASTSNTMKGATAEVNGSATTTIKGGMVMIN